MKRPRNKPWRGEVSQSPRRKWRNEAAVGGGKYTDKSFTTDPGDSISKKKRK